ncbi:MAG TPA: AAA domain-containing protein, partial [Bdellovibrio sp.]|nr:AAA domain-containing protein [Bdellovibrio sp.]
TESALLKNEAMKRARIIPVREITRRAGKALQEIKPCWMMSPLTVAQYIPKGTLEFDLVIIDEASQMTPENAIGAICRGKQVMVVGDTNQLPPSNFFGKMFALQDNEDEDEGVVDESILEMANKVFLPARRLSWHYRSRHESLIAFSNRYIYHNKLVIFPSPCQNTSLYGVSQVYIPGEYRSSINHIEAKEMIQAVLKFIQEHPDLSLGVVVMNQKQKDLMEQEWSYALHQNPEAKDYTSYWNKKDGGLEKFFIKNLENVQGDERDVIFIGTVYGPERVGEPVMQRFGPINGVAGKRRLNVLFSRAKQQIITFTSMKPQDVLADESKPGPYMLKKWLEFTSNQGNFSIGEATHRLPDSDFEECVIAVVEQLGCIAVPQVGVSGYFIDIGVKHPKWENDFLFGIECDGASYHSSKSARDRDRLRQEVLESKGWKLHRIWST